MLESASSSARLEDPDPTRSGRSSTLALRGCWSEKRDKNLEFQFRMAPQSEAVMSSSDDFTGHESQRLPESPDHDEADREKAETRHTVGQRCECRPTQREKKIYDLTR